MKVVLVEPEERDGKVLKALAKGLNTVSEELGITKIVLQGGTIEVMTEDPVRAHMVISRFPGVHRVGVFEKATFERADKALIEVAKKVLRSDMTFELSVEVFGRGDPVSLYYDLMGKLIESVEACLLYTSPSPRD